MRPERHPFSPSGEVVPDPAWAEVLSDASHCPHSRAAGWAVWIEAAGDPQPLRRHGCLRKGAATSTEVEIWAAAQGVAFAAQAGATHVLLFVDCLAVFDAVMRPKCRTTRAWTEALGQALEALGAKKPVIVASHFKGHSEGRDPRSAAHRWCDATAKEVMRAAREGRPVRIPAAPLGVADRPLAILETA